MIEGIINFDKPAGCSSAAMVGRVKRLLPRGVKIGHAGTLDPFATGVLLLLLGKATRWCESLMDQPKGYDATLKLGVTTPTDDPESPESITPDAQPISRAELEAALRPMVGTVLQRPPAYSAMKVGGRRAYALAREGEIPVLAPRPVRIHRVQLLDYQWPLGKIHVDCGRGTYIRAIARDIGNALGVGGTLVSLCRTAVGPFHLAGAVTFETVALEGIEAHLHPLPAAASPTILKAATESSVRLD